MAVLTRQQQLPARTHLQDGVEVAGVAVVEHACRERARSKGAACGGHNAGELLDAELLAAALRVLLWPPERGRVSCCKLGRESTC